ncbi:MAG: cob(I)yrinic acid a,c-diamide adenosyltransferase [Deinococcales bacterium]
MKIYTKTGDSGETGLYGGERVPKTAQRVEAYGTVDECNSAIGMARASLEDDELDAVLAQIQNALFDVGADLATPSGSQYEKNLVRIDREDVTKLEQLIDKYQLECPEFTGFIHPSGTPAAAALHLARTIARRAEREVLRLEALEQNNHEVVLYLNRLSDFLFTLSRVINARSGVPETDWLVKGRR